MSDIFSSIEGGNLSGWKPLIIWDWWGHILGVDGIAGPSMIWFNLNTDDYMKLNFRLNVIIFTKEEWELFSYWFVRVYNCLFRGFHFILGSNAFSLGTRAKLFSFHFISFDAWYHMLTFFLFIYLISKNFVKYSLNPAKFFKCIYYVDNFLFCWC